MSIQSLLEADWYTRNYETREYHLAYSKLIEAARNRGTVTYQELADVMDKIPHGSHLAQTSGGMGGAINLNEHLHGRPMLSAILVNISGKPGEGFFQLARDLGRLRSNHPADEERFWEEEKRAVYEVWQKSFKAK